MELDRNRPFASRDCIWSRTTLNIEQKKIAEIGNKFEYCTSKKERNNKEIPQKVGIRRAQPV